VLRDWCAKAGVAVVFVRELPGTRSHGVARWLSPEKALIQLSTRYKSDDQIWFSFFHEAGHISLDGKKIASIESDAEQVQEGTEAKAREDRANAFAAETLIPQRSLDRFLAENHSRHLSKANVEEFAKRIDSAPGIVVGCLQYEGVLGRNLLNGLKNFYDWPNGVVF